MSERFSFVAIAIFMFLSLPVQAQSADQFIYDSFSYDKDALFGQRQWSTAPAPVIPQQQAPIITSVVEETKLETQATAHGDQQIAQDAVISQADQFKLQMEVDKAHSRILKLTLDYNALRNQIERVAKPSKQKSSSWSFLGDSEQKKFEELQALNRKQLVEREKQIQVVQTRLNALQKRYDNENVSRLLAEKRLKIVQDQEKKSQAKRAKANEKVNYLAKQLEDKQKIIRQLKIQLTDEKLKNFKIDDEAKQSAHDSAQQNKAVQDKATTTELNKSSDQQ